MGVQLLHVRSLESAKSGSALVGAMCLLRNAPKVDPCAWKNVEEAISS